MKKLRGIWLCGWVLWIHTLTHTHTMPGYPGNTAENVLLTSTSHKSHLSNHLSIEIQGDEEVAKKLAHKYQLHYVCKVFSDPPVYHLHLPLYDDRFTNHHHHHHHHHITRRSNHNIVQLLSSEPGVKWVQQEKTFVRVKRDRVLAYGGVNRYTDRRKESTGWRDDRKKDMKHTHEKKRKEDEAEEDKETNKLKYNTRTSLKSYYEMKRDENKNEKLYKETKQNNGNNNENENLIRNQKEENVKTFYSNYETRKTLHNNKIRAHTNKIRTYNENENEENRKIVRKSGKVTIKRYLQQTENDKIRMYEENHSCADTTKCGASVASSQNVETKIMKREKKDDDFLQFNDPLFPEQWYLHDSASGGGDLNVTSAWRLGYTGQGVTVSILDDGIQTTNPDIADNYDPSVSYSVVRDGRPESDPSPRLESPDFYFNSHGTKCAGVVAAVANNGVCGVGVAYGAKVGGVRIVDGSITDIQEAVALSRHVDRVGVFSASWGPQDDGAHTDGPGPLSRRALTHGITNGRGGLGTIYVWASGNGGLKYDNCNMDGYASSVYTLTVSALTHKGESPFYSERCASTMASVYVGGQHTLKQAIIFNNTDKNVVVPEVDGHCSNGFQGSSAAAPLMAGVVALMLEANPSLSWRDVQHLVVTEATPAPAATGEEGWRTNARGKKFHLMQGFGAINAGKMVEAALSWKNIGPQIIHTIKLLDDARQVVGGWNNVSGEVVMHNTTLMMTGVEQVVATVTLRHPHRRTLRMYIISPSGTESQVLTERPYDTAKSGFESWGFTSVHFWGEAPSGVWTLAIQNPPRMHGLLINTQLTLYGY